MTSWLQVIKEWLRWLVLGRKGGKPKTRLKLDKWFVVFLAVLLWSLSTILFKYAFVLPYALNSPALWLRMLGVIVAIFAWIWLFRIYVGSARNEQKRLREIGELLAKVRGRAEPGQELGALEGAVEELRRGETPTVKGGK